MLQEESLIRSRRPESAYLRSDLAGTLGLSLRGLRGNENGGDQPNERVGGA